MEPSSMQAFRANFSATESGRRPLLRCWSHQDCRGCLADDECSWCPFTWACVPNSHPIPLLAPAYDTHVCPHPSEQWELRTRPFGCRVSTTTSLSALVAFLAALLLVSWAVLNVVALRRWRRYTAQKPEWDQGFNSPWRTGWMPPDSREQQPLLGEQAGR
ncbi:hypothetical protein G6O67_002430 [Ophiocordyceps sinensis]|uniref:PSI domain-containing protein n=1 Tax=Ophiocordyceps sinensis TaxID=72228 RepID=A0A8H4PUB2_9HYPO|nr:hypothetical protein G6O67_002430 [Ophiocordyceps sinensis]